MSATTSEATASLTPDINAWRRRKQSKGKLRKFFGKSAPVDISVKDIEDYGLPALLNSNIPLCYFLHFLLETFRAENLFFYMESTMFEDYDFTTKKQLKQSARELYNNFIKEGSEFEINIEGSIRKRIQEGIEEYDQTCFNESRQHVLLLLQPCLQDFMQSKSYERLKNDTKGNTTIYDTRARDRGIKILMEHLDKTLDLEERALTTKDPEAVMKARHQILVRMLVHTFCKTRLRADFRDKASGENLPKPSASIFAKDALVPF